MLRAPCSAIHVDTDRPRPPSPPVIRYGAVESKCKGWRSRGLTGIAETSGILTTAFPTWSPSCSHRYALSTSVASNTVILSGPFNFPWPMYSNDRARALELR